MLMRYSRVTATAQTWAADPHYSDHLRRLAQCLAENAATLSSEFCVDEQTWRTIARFSCLVCNRLGNARCDSLEVPTPECPLGIGHL